MEIKEWIKGFFKGTFGDILFGDLERETKEREEILLTLLLLHFAGLENPLYFYLLEVLPYLKIDENFMRRIIAKEELLPVLFSRYEGWA